MVKEYDASAIPSVHNLIDVPKYRDDEGFTQVIFRGLDQMVGFTVIEPSKPDSTPHSHSFEQMNLLLEGSLDMIVADEVVHLVPYDSLVIPPGIEHTSQATDERAMLLAIWPLREDRLDAVEYQMEFSDDSAE